MPIVNNRMYIPQSLQREVLDTLHLADQGVSTMKNADRPRFFWPGMDAAIAQVRSQCATCNGMAPLLPCEDLAEPELPTVPFQDISMDYFALKGHTYAVKADRYSGWLTVRKFGMTKFSELLMFLREQVTWHRVPLVIEMDGSPPFNSAEWKSFHKKWGIKHRLSSAGYPQSNSRAEPAVKTAMRVLADNVMPRGTLERDASESICTVQEHTSARTGQVPGTDNIWPPTHG